MEFGHIFFILTVIFNFVEVKKLIWKYDSDIANPENWISGKLSTDCKGVHFAPVNSAPVYITQLITPELTLPLNGEIDIIDGGFIEFKDNRKCIKLKPLDYHEWYDPSSWIQPDSNPAIPDLHKVPCNFDDVVFPKIFHTRILLNYGSSITVRSINWGLEQSKVRNLETSKLRKQILQNLYNDVTLISETGSCEDPDGCLCHDTYIPCPENDKTVTLACSNPIVPEESCQEICGAYVTISPRQGPSLTQVRKKLKDYSVSTYASRVNNYLNNDEIQVVFTESQYEGKSLEEAENFVKYLESLNIRPLEFSKSGALHVESSNNAVAIVFGTLVLVVAFFGMVVYFNGGTSVRDILTRLRINPRRVSAFNVPFFARFDNTDENLIMDGQSEAGSVLDIAKSFDNPMYGQGTESTTTTGTSGTISTHHENPLYDIIKEPSDMEKENEKDTDPEE